MIQGHRAKELLFTECGDTNGVFYWLGTNGKTTRWTNPHRMGLVKVTCSSPVSRYTKLETLVGRTFVTTSMASGKPAWWAVELTAHTLVCNHYSLHMDGSAGLFRNWVLQGWKIYFHFAEN